MMSLLEDSKLREAELTTQMGELSRQLLSLERTRAQEATRDAADSNLSPEGNT